MVVPDPVAQISATMAATADANEVPSPTRRHPTVYHPVISSVVRANTMKNCVEVKDMYAQCQMSAQTAGMTEVEDSFMCRTAQRYHDLCLQGLLPFADR